MNEKDNDNLVYEVGFHLLPVIEESNVPTEALNIKAIIEENGGTIISEEMPKMVALAYDISKVVDTKRQKFNKAYFGWVKFEMDPSQILNVKNKVESSANVLRSLIVKTVREDTLHAHKIPMFRKENPKEEKGEDVVEKPKVSEAELDKSIDELVINQVL
jgi:ribosomal protein S6